MKLPALKWLYLTSPDLTVPNLALPDLTRPNLTYPVLTCLTWPNQV